ncbi:MAG: glutathione S-transferase family protein [Kiloniellales bacterium]|nr:glutathione S-transferase family protein [Kiloniellales bacterium]
MAGLTLYGAAYSVYVRIARLVLEEAGAAYDLVEVDIFAPETVPADYGSRHPFGKIPAFEHEGFRLFETDAIADYVNEAFGAGALLPASPRDRAQCRQIMRIMDNYAYPALVWGVFVDEVEGEETAGDDALDASRLVLEVLSGLAAGPFLLGERVSLADLWAWPMMVYFRMAPSGEAMLRDFPALEDWCGVMAERPSVVKTRVKREGGASPA